PARAPVPGGAPRSVALACVFAARRRIIAARGSAHRPYSSVAQVEQSASERVAEARGRYVARGVATPRLVVANAEGAHVTDPDGRTYLDFAGGIACQNTRHRFEPLAAAIHDQVDRYLHPCSM